MMNLKQLLAALCCLLASNMPGIGQNVGIGTLDPATKLDVKGSIASNEFLFVVGAIGVGYFPGESLNYKLTIKGGSLAFYDATDDLYWRFFYDNAANRFHFGTVIAGSLSTKMVITNNGSVGINTLVPGYRLDIGGNMRATGDMLTGGSFYAAGNAYVDNDKGLVRASTSGLGNMKIHKENYSVNAVLAAHEASGEFTMSWASGIFAVTPTVFACNETFTALTTGELRRVIVKIYDCTTTSCKGRLINTDSAPVNYEIKFDVLMIGR